MPSLENTVRLSCSTPLAGTQSHGLSYCQECWEMQPPWRPRAKRKQNVVATQQFSTPASFHWSRVCGVFIYSHTLSLIVIQILPASFMLWAQHSVFPCPLLLAFLQRPILGIFLQQSIAPSLLAFFFSCLSTDTLDCTFQETSVPSDLIICLFWCSTWATEVLLKWTWSWSWCQVDSSAWAYPGSWGWVLSFSCGFRMI